MRSREGEWLKVELFDDEALLREYGIGEDEEDLVIREGEDLVDDDKDTSSDEAAIS